MGDWSGKSFCCSLAQRLACPQKQSAGSDSLLFLQIQVLMQIVRMDILGTLSAGRAEGGAYNRGYTNVTRCPFPLSNKFFALTHANLFQHQVEHAP